MFTWIPIHEETAKRLLEFKNRQSELIDLLARMHDAGLVAIPIMDRDTDGNGFQLREINPFLFLANFNRGIRQDNRQALWRVLKQEWKLKSPIPEDFDGLPVANKMNSWFMPYAETRITEHVPLLWEFFEHMMRVDVDMLDRNLMQKSIDLFKIKLPMLTMGMFWACPRKWISTDGKNLEFADTKGIADTPKSAVDYISWLPQIREAIGGDGVEFSRQAHLWSLSQKLLNGGKTVKSDNSPWWQRFFESKEQGYAAFELFHEACRGLGVTDTKDASAQRVSFTNTKNGGKERLRLNCANTLVLEITSNPVEKPNVCFIARIEEQGNEQTPVERFTTRSGLMHGLYAADLADLLAQESDSRRMFFQALGDVALIYKDIKKRHFENAHRPRLLYAAFHDERRADILENGPTRGPSDDPNPISTPSKHESAKNLILYGPPGTGKTYSTIDRALEIIDPTIVASTMADMDGRAQRKARFDELLQAKRIGFVTFHQSFSYEDFVEGLKASTDEEGQVKYEVEDGIFKQMCSAATASSGGISAGHAKTLDPAGRTIWKMSLGNTLGPDASIYEECIENGYVLLGWGQDIDFSGASTWDHIKEKVKERKSDGVDSEYTVTACHAFVNMMKPGDLIIVSDGNHKFRAIGVVKGDYRFLPVAEDREQLYQQCRDVDWIRTYSPSLPSDQLMTVAFSQMSLYRLKQPAIDLDLVRLLLSENEVTETGTPRPFVLIIDEINRGNISRIFGELITLIEDSKRAGKPESLEVKLPYSKKMFSVPANLYLIGTMNTADRSLAQLDIALRRRFVFEELMPAPSILEGLSIEGINLSRMLTAINQRIEILYDREHMIGHTFFLSLFDKPTMEELKRIFTGSILPLLEEYFFEDWEKIRLVLADNRKPAALAMIVPKYTDTQLEALFGQEPRHNINPVYQRNANALAMPRAYVGIYDSAASVTQLDSTSVT